jgi:hypothetical protein
LSFFIIRETTFLEIPFSPRLINFTLEAHTLSSILLINSEFPSWNISMSKYAFECPIDLHPHSKYWESLFLPAIVIKMATFVASILFVIACSHKAAENNRERNKATEKIIWILFIWYLIGTICINIKPLNINNKTKV